MKTHDLDLARIKRQGFPEIVYGERKTIGQLTEIIQLFLKTPQGAFITRLQPEKAALLKIQFKDAHYNELARTMTVVNQPRVASSSQPVKVVAAGTSDAYLVEEIKETLSFLDLGCHAFMDKGIAGIHRLQSVLPAIAPSDVVICVAGFEGALPSVVAGLIANPIIAVPSSVGYGVAANGMAALNSMLASCANGILVVNIDNGFGAAMAAYRIIKGRTG